MGACDLGVNLPHLLCYAKVLFKALLLSATILDPFSVDFHDVEVYIRFESH